MPEWVWALLGGLAGIALGVWLTFWWVAYKVGFRSTRRPWWRRDPNRCSVTEETGGYFIGRRHCHAHNVVWDDGGRCPRAGREPGDPFVMTSSLREQFPGRS